MKKARIALCDRDASYRARLHGFLKHHLHLPVLFAEYSDVESLLSHEDAASLTLIITDEVSAASHLMDSFPRLLVLTEDGEDATYRSEEQTVYARVRYRRASDIAELVLEILSEDPDIALGKTGEGQMRARLIGYYSPLGRCMQTSMAISAGLALAKKDRTIYLNFAPYAMKSLKGRDGDLADLLYYHECARDKFPVWIERVKGQIGALEYIPPAAHFMKTEGTTGADWVSLVTDIAKETDAGYLLLDLPVMMQGLSELLYACDDIYTVTGHDTRDKEKIAAYKSYLMTQEEEEILQKTTFCALPKACPLPSNLRQLSSGALATYLWNNRLIPQEKIPA